MGGGSSNSIDSKTIRNLEILNFHLSLPIIHTPSNFKFLNKVQKGYHRLFRKKWTLLEQDITDLHQIPKNARIEGYFQNISFLSDIADELLEEFSLPTLSLHNQQWKEKILKTPNSAFIHIRRGDHLWGIHWEYVKLGKAYYDKAIQHIQSKFPNAHFFIFSNDIPWCKENIKLFEHLNEYNTTFVEGNHEGMAVEEMELMKACQHSIMANSTFSWWAGFLNPNPSKICIFPSQFFYNPKIDIAKDLTVSDWISIDPIWGKISDILN